MRKGRASNNSTSVAIRFSNGVIELYPIVVVKALALQRILGVDKLNNN